MDKNAFVRKVVDKRAITKEELELYEYVGEAIGILKFSPSVTDALVKNCEEFLAVAGNLKLNWEHVLNIFLPKVEVQYAQCINHNWIEIDTPEDYQRAQTLFDEGKQPHDNSAI